MSSAAYDFRIDHVEDQQVRVHVEIVMPHVKRIPLEPNFALQIILEPFENMLKGKTHALPFGAEEAEKISGNHPLKSECETWLAMYQRKTIRISRETHSTIEDPNAEIRQLYPNMGGWGMSGNSFYIYTTPDYDSFLALAEEEILSVNIENPFHYPRSFNRCLMENDRVISEAEHEAFFEHNPAADLVIKVKNIDLLDHLRPGIHWNSAIQDFSTLLFG